jgi:signal transduction histidine kinase
MTWGEQEQVFQRGYTTKELGYGFGLHFVANFVTEYGGKITAESDGRGEGCGIVILLNVAPEPQDM